jgi:3-oxoacyl-(acyl-carrier-protein) synthase
MKRNLAITGTGAVTPAGWGVRAMMAALASGETLTPAMLERVRGDSKIITPVLRVPGEGATTPKAARLRRTSPISKFAAAAAMEALGEARLTKIAAGLRVGVIFTLTNGCVNYSNRFFSEVLADPALASPILFPETVFNAPSSHLSAMIGSPSPNDTLVGDGSGFLTGMDLAAEWIERGDVDGCLVVASEETDWLSAEALRLYSRRYIPSEGAGAIYLEAADGPAALINLPDPVPYNSRDRHSAAREIRDALGASDEGETLLVDSLSGIRRFDFPEIAAWSDWTGPRWSPKLVLGESMGAASAFQVVAAVEALKSGRFRHAVVSSVGSNQQAAGVLLGS